MRLIDVDALPNYKLIGTMALGSERSPAELRIVLWEDIKSMPTIDAVPVVRCRECRRFLPYTAEYKAKVEKADGDCGVLIFSCIDHQYAARQVDDFCSYGQRKEDGHGTVQ